MTKQEFVGRTMKYITAQGETRTARCVDVTYHEQLKTNLYHGVSPNNHRVRLTENEVFFEKGM